LHICAVAGQRQQDKLGRQSSFGAKKKIAYKSHHDHAVPSGIEYPPPGTQLETQLGRPPGTPLGTPVTPAVVAATPAAVAVTTAAALLTPKTAMIKALTKQLRGGLKRAARRNSYKGAKHTKRS
jgi:hypothetical protein